MSPSPFNPNLEFSMVSCYSIFNLAAHGWMNRSSALLVAALTFYSDCYHHRTISAAVLYP
tara:strand:- start:3628 stop:3807 length:180 start_codon:yes stop_codon:yes gene_type:complete